MSRTFHNGKRGRERPIRVRGVRRDPPDLRGIARVLIALAQVAEAEASAEAEDRPTKPSKTSNAPKSDSNRDKAGDEAA
jgi:hypothetical protein